MVDDSSYPLTSGQMNRHNKVQGRSFLGCPLHPAHTVGGRSQQVSKHIAASSSLGSFHNACPLCLLNLIQSALSII